jgi:hypothetical protein
MTGGAPEKMTGENAEVTIAGIPVALADCEITLKVNEVSQERLTNRFPRKWPGTADFSIKVTRLDIDGENMARAMASGAVASTRTVFNSCDASANWAKAGTLAAASAISLDTSNKKKGTGCILVTNTGDASGNTIIATEASQNWSGYHMLEGWVRSSVTGSNVLSVGFGESAITENTKTVEIQKANTWQRVAWDISAIADTSKNAVTKVGVTLGSDSSGNTVYLDGFNALKGVTLGTPETFDMTIRVAHVTDDTSYVDYFVPDCSFLGFSLALKGGADTPITTPLDVSIADASKIQLFYS